jgi:hypothetical protein
MNFHSAHHSFAVFCLSTIMQTMRESWTDERLDDGFDRVSADIQLLRDEMRAMRVELRQDIGSVRQELRHELHQGIGSVRLELHQGIGSVQGEIGSVRGEIASLRQSFDDLRNILIYMGGAMVIGMLGVLVAAFGILIKLA